MFDIRTFYRKLPHENVWHFCRNCENWPQFGYGERKDIDFHSATFCPRCIQHHRESQCEWVHLELSPDPRFPPSARLTSSLVEA